MPSPRLLAGLLLLGACLPEAGPPSGVRLIAQRGMSELSLAAAPGAHVLFTRAAPPSASASDNIYDDTRRRDLFALPRAGGAERALLRDQPSWSFSPLWDARGRLYLLTSNFAYGPGGEPGAPWQLTRFDPGSGEMLAFGGVSDVQLSSDRSRLHYQPAGGRGVIRELDERERSLGEFGESARFLGETLYFVALGQLFVFGPQHETPERLVAGIGAWEPLSAPDAAEPILYAERFGPNEMREIMIVRPASRPPRVDRVVASRVVSMVAVSADGERVAYAESLGSAQVRVHVVRPADGSAVVADLPAAPAPPDEGQPHGPGVAPPRPDGRPPSSPSDHFLASIELAFRPGSDEVWCYLSRALRVVRADGSVLVVDGRHPTNAGLDTGSEETASRGPAPGYVPTRRSTIQFSNDGRRWVYSDGYYEGNVMLGDAALPTAPGLLIGRRREVQRVLEAQPGQLYAWLRPGEAGRVDLHVIDLASLQRRVLANDVRRAVLGATRALAVVRGLGHDDGSPGDLVLIDLASGAERLLGRNVTEFALAAVCPTCDRTAPGVPLAFVVNARLPFPYDGLWTAELP